MIMFHGRINIAKMAILPKKYTTACSSYVIPMKMPMGLFTELGKKTENTWENIENLNS